MIGHTKPAPWNVSPELSAAPRQLWDGLVTFIPFWHPGSTLQQDIMRPGTPGYFDENGTPDLIAPTEYGPALTNYAHLYSTFTVPHNPDWYTTNAFSIVGWATRTGFGGTYDALFNTENFNAKQGMYFGDEEDPSSTVNLRVNGDQNSAARGSSNGGTPYNSWHSWIGSWDGSAERVLVDNQQIGGYTKAHNLASSGKDAQIMHGFEGALSYLLVYNRRLTAFEGQLLTDDPFIMLRPHPDLR